MSDRDSAEPFGVLTGDALFIGDVGRPDLLGSAGLSADQLARQCTGRFTRRSSRCRTGRGYFRRTELARRAARTCRARLVDDRRAAGDQLRPGPDERGRVRGSRHRGPARRAAVFLLRARRNREQTATARGAAVARRRYRCRGFARASRAARSCWTPANRPTSPPVICAAR